MLKTFQITLVHSLRPANSEGSGTDSPEQLLLADAINTEITCTGPYRL